MVKERYQHEKVRLSIGDRKVIVSVIGLGYMALPLTVAFAEAGFRVVGIEVGKTGVESIKTTDCNTLCEARPWSPMSEQAIWVH